MNKFANILILSMVSILSVFAEGYSIPKRTNNNLIVASYNIKWFGQSVHDLQKISEVVQHFDVCGIIEVKNENIVKQLTDKLTTLTSVKWSYCFGIRTKRPNGSYFESFAVVWRTDRVSLGNGIISNIWDLDEVYRNDPFLVSFNKEGFDFTLLLVHTRWESDDEGNRAEEVRRLVDQIEFLNSFLDEKDIIIAGDFNFNGNSNEIKSFLLVSSFIQIDPNVNTTFKNDYSGYNESYDHIFINKSHTIEYNGESGVLDSTLAVYGDNSKASMKKSKEELSDHLPVWAIFNISNTDDD